MQNHHVTHSLHLKPGERKVTWETSSRTFLVRNHGPAQTAFADFIA